MPRLDDGFWSSIFRKSPLIATFMALGGIIAFGIGCYYFVDRKWVSLRLILCLIFSTTLGGIFIGLIVGVVLDSLVDSFRDNDKKKRK